MPVFLLDYEIWMDLRQVALYQFDRTLAGESVILRANLKHGNCAIASIPLFTSQFGTGSAKYAGSHA
jgi:hypothetical protein